MMIPTISNVLKHNVALALLVFLSLFLSSSLFGANCDCEKFNQVKAINDTVQASDFTSGELFWESKEYTYSNAERLRFTLSANYSNNASAVVWIYDGSGNVIEYFDIKNIPKNSTFISKVIPGKTGRIALRGSPTGINSFTVSSIDVSAKRIITPDKIVDGNEKLDKIGTDAATHNFVSGIAKLVIGTQRVNSKQAQESARCTGFLVAPNLLMSAAHCFKGKPHRCDSTVAVFNYGETVRDNTYARACKKVVYNNEVLDVIVLELSGNNQAAHTGYKMYTHNPSGDLRIYQHPLGMPMRISDDLNCKVISNTAKGAVFVVRAHDHVDGIAFTHKCDTHDGSSGAPIFEDRGGALTLVGLHSSYNSVQHLNKGVKGSTIGDCIGIDKSTNSVTVKKNSVLCKKEL